eukprot:scaffold779_cov205-Alexandrium_tamarense.AAC.37
MKKKSAVASGPRRPLPAWAALALVVALLPGNSDINSNRNFAYAQSSQMPSAKPSSSSITYFPSSAVSLSRPPSEMPSASPTFAVTAQPTVGPVIAYYEPTFGVPVCPIVGTSCSSGSLLNSRGVIDNGPPEPNHSNTFDGCQDGNDGTYFSDESIESITVSVLDSDVLREYATVEVEAVVHAWSATQDYADFYYGDEATLSWVLIGTVQPAGTGIQSVKIQYTLPPGDMQALRVQFRFQGTDNPCDSGSYSDRDDLFFTVSWGQLTLSTAKNEYGAFGTMFYLRSFGEVTIESLDVYTGSVKPNVTIEVYTLPGKYIGHEVDATGWSLIYNNTAGSFGPDVPITLGGLNVDVAYGDYQSFFIWSPHQKVLYNLGTTEEALYSSNNYLEFYEGVGLTGIFSGDANDVWAPRTPSMAPTYTPLIMSTAQNEYSAFGSMFYLKALGKTTVTSFTIYTEFASTNDIVEVYTRPGKYLGREVNQTGWTLIYNNTSLDLLGQDVPTEILGLDVTILQNNIQSFFVWSPNQKVMYNLGTAEEALFSSNEHLEFYEGAGITVKFSNDLGDVWAPRVLRGTIR